MRLLFYPLTYSAGGVILAGLFPVVRSDWRGLLILGGLLCLYAFMASKDTHVDKQVKGDNCYIISFIYTLGVITMTLALDTELLLAAPAETVAGSAERGPAVLLETIGVALGTSVIGMMLRTYFNYSVSSSDDEFHDHVRATAIAASLMAGEVKALTDATQQAKDELHRYAEALQKESLHVTDALNNSYARVVDELAEKIEKTLQHNLFDEIRENLSRAVDAHRDAVTQVRVNLTQSLETLNTAVLSSNESAEEFVRIIGQLQSSLDPTKFQGIHSAFQAISDGSKEVKKAQDELLKAYEENLRDWGSGTAELTAQFRQDIDRIASFKEEFKQEYEEAVKQAAEEKEKLYGLLIGSAEFLEERLEGKGSPKADGTQQ